MVELSPSVPHLVLDLADYFRVVQNHAAGLIDQRSIDDESFGVDIQPLVLPFDRERDDRPHFPMQILGNEGQAAIGLHSSLHSIVDEGLAD